MNRMMVLCYIFAFVVASIAGGVKFTYELDGPYGPESPHREWMRVSSRLVMHSRKRLDKDAEALIPWILRDGTVSRGKGV